MILWSIIIVIMLGSSIYFLVYTNIEVNIPNVLFWLVFLLGISTSLYHQGKGGYATDYWVAPILRGEVYKIITTAKHNGKNLVLMSLADRSPEYFKVEWDPPEVGKCFVVVDAEETYASETEC